MFAPPSKHHQAETPEAKPHRADAVAGDRPALEANPIWQSLALRSTFFQPKLTISQPDDPYEREADEISDRVMRMAEPPMSPSRVFAHQTSATIQRKCDQCEEDEEKKLYRKERDPTITSVAGASPGIHQTLQSPGRPLDSETRAFMEPRFGYDFSRVVVHDDAQASASAEAVRANAYTLGSHIVFNAGAFSPGSTKGRQLLAHELSHVVQQASGEQTLQRDDKPDAGKPNAEEKPATVNKAGASLTAPEREALIKKFGAPSNSTAAPATGKLQFVLHDTASDEPGANRKGDLVRWGHTALGEGYVATIPATNPAVVTSKTFFESHRVTATQEEQADTVLTEAAREPLLRQAWAAVDPTAREDALDVALAKQPDFLDPSKEKQFKREVKDYRAETRAELKGSKKIHTGGYWTVEELCRKAKVAGIASVIGDFVMPPSSTAQTPAGSIAGLPGAIADTIAAGIKAIPIAVAGVAAVMARRQKFNDACAALDKLFAARMGVVQSSTHVELVEPEEKGSTDCSPTAAKKLSNPYTSHQYQVVVELYLKATLEAGRFPFITTHYFVQQALGDRCDPRCFDLGNLYQLLQKELGHPPNTIYGLPTKYGEKFSGESIWWHPKVCSGQTKTTI